MTESKTCAHRVLSPVSNRCLECALRADAVVESLNSRLDAATARLRKAEDVLRDLREYGYSNPPIWAPIKRYFEEQT